MRYFSLDEFNCQHTRNNEMDEGFLNLLDNLREVCDFPFIITSGYRDLTHPIEARKTRPGAHTYGKAADIRARGDKALLIVQKALELGFTGIGVSQKGAHGSRFIHVDNMTTEEFAGGNRPWIWSY
jgi:zinc D-Ala-D-Ala carboxypeptidase